MPYTLYMTSGALTLAAMNVLLPALLPGGTPLPTSLALALGAGLGFLFCKADRHASRS